MIGPRLVATSVKHVWTGAIVLAFLLVSNSCELPGAEHTAVPATPTPAAGPAVTRPTPATGTVATVPPPAARAAVTPSPVTSLDAARLSSAATPVIPGWVTARATRGAGAVATAQAGVSATAQAEASATARAVAEEAMIRAAVEEQKRHRTTAMKFSRCVHGAPGGDHVRWTANGAHILLADNAEVWAVTPDGAHLWWFAQAWGQAKFEGDPSPAPFGLTTSFDVTPDSRQVVYATCRYPPEWPGDQQPDPFAFDYELAVVGLDGQNPRRLTRHRAFDNYPAWSPDGSRVAFVSGRDDPDLGLYGGTGLYTMAADGGDVRRLAPDLEGVAWQPPAWSPDGRSIAVAAGSWDLRKEGHALYVVPADGAGFVRLSEAVSGGAWSPDGTRLAFAQPFGAEVELYTIAADGADARRVTTIYGWQRGSGVPDARQAWIHTIAWSPDGSKLLYACGEHQFCVVTLDGAPVGATVPPDGQRTVGEATLLGDHAVWSPDGGRIAVASRPGPRVYNAIALYSAAPDGSDRQTLAWRGVGLVAAGAKDEDLATSRAACAAGYVVPAPEANPGLVRDCATLLSVREALFGRLLVNWGSGSPLARWEGVTVAGAPPRVTGLDLRARDLGFSLLETRGGLTLGSPGHGGTIPVELGALERLQHLDLSQNTLNGPIPAELENLTHLKELRLHNYGHLTGCIPVGLKRVPDNDLAELGLPYCEAGS